MCRSELKQGVHRYCKVCVTDYDPIQLLNRHEFVENDVVSAIYKRTRLDETCIAYRARIRVSSTAFTNESLHSYLLLWRLLTVWSALEYSITEIVLC